MKDVLKPKKYDYPPFENPETLPYTDEKNSILEIVTSGLDEVVRYLVEFVKSIPGFRELSISDQSSLLKGEHKYIISYTVKPAHADHLY